MTVPRKFGIREDDLVELVVPNDLRSARKSEERIMGDLARHRYGPNVTFAIKLALEEALTNAVRHGNGNDASKQLVVRYSVTPRRAVIMVRDEGSGFSLTRIPDPTSDENLERPNGRGIMLMHAYMTRVHFNRAGNEVWMLKDNVEERPALSTG